MPCYEPPDGTEVRVVTEYVDNPKLEAALCGILGVLEGNQMLDFTLNLVDWEEQGIKKSWVVKWWAKHKKKDGVRRRKETLKIIEVVDKGLSKIAMSPRQRAKDGI